MNKKYFLVDTQVKYPGVDTYPTQFIIMGSDFKDAFENFNKFLAEDVYQNNGEITAMEWREIYSAYGNENILNVY